MSRLLIVTYSILLFCLLTSSAINVVKIKVPTAAMSSPIVSRASLMIRASIISDAASMPLHWIYNQADVATKVGRGEAAFYPTPSCPFYSYPSGELSPYGEESMPILRSLSEVGAYEHDHAATQMYEAYRVYPEEGNKGYAGRLNHAPKMFVEARAAGKAWEECGQDDSQANGIAKVALIVARYAGSHDLLEKIASMVRILQNNDLSVTSAQLVGKILERILLHKESPKDAILALHDESGDSFTSFQKHMLSFVHSDAKIADWVRFAQKIDASPSPADDPYRNPRIKGQLFSHYLNDFNSLQSTIEGVALSAEERHVVEAAHQAAHSENHHANEEIAHNAVANAVGLSCALPAALVNSLYVMRKAATLEDAIHINTMMAGDNCSRALVIGAAFGAAGSAIPEAWTTKVNAKTWAEVTSAADKVAQGNAHLL